VINFGEIMKKSILLNLLLIVSFSVFANWQDLNSQGKKDLRSGNMHLSGGRLEKALPLYETVLQDNPNHIETLEKIAGIYFDVKKDYAKAHELYSVIIEKINGKHAEYEELKLADKKSANKMYKKEIKKYKLAGKLESALKFKSNCWRMLFISAQEKLQDDNFEEALIGFQLVYDIAPDSIKTIKMLSYIYEKLENVNKSIEYLVKMTELDANNDTNYTQIANKHFQLENYEEAIKWYKNAIEVNDQNTDNYYNLAIVYSKTENDSGKFDALLKVHELDSENGDVLVQLSNLTAKMGLNVESIEFLKKVVDLDNENLSNMQILCGKLFGEKMYEDLIVYGQKWYEVATDKNMPAQFVYQAAKLVGNKEIETKFEKILREMQ
jgi:tetratricopeptide (TPR) repeat protein